MSSPSDCNGDLCRQYPLEALVTTALVMVFGALGVGPVVATTWLIVAGGASGIAGLARRRPWLVVMTGSALYSVVVALWLGAALADGPDWRPGG